MSYSFVTELLYIHSKLMIVDDRRVIVSSTVDSVGIILIASVL